MFRFVQEEVLKKYNEVKIAVSYTHLIVHTSGIQCHLGNRIGVGIGLTTVGSQGDRSKGKSK